MSPIHMLVPDVAVDHSVLGCTARNILGPLNSIKEATVQIEGNKPLTTKGADKSVSLARGCLRCAQRFYIQILGGVHVSTVLVISTVVIMIPDV